MKYIPELTEKDLKRFWSKVQVLDEDSCWPWVGGKTGDYGQFNICRDNKKDKYRAHRISLFIKDNREQEVARHKCDNPICCNPNHLEWGTHQDNVDDMMTRNRHSWGDTDNYKFNPKKGVEVSNHKFEESDIIEIRKLYDNGEENMVSIARRYQVNKSCIFKIVKRLAWKHVI